MNKLKLVLLMATVGFVADSFGMDIFIEAAAEFVFGNDQTGAGSKVSPKVGENGQGQNSMNESVQQEWDDQDATSDDEEEAQGQKPMKDSVDLVWHDQVGKNQVGNESGSDGKEKESSVSAVQKNKKKKKKDNQHTRRYSLDGAEKERYDDESSDSDQGQGQLVRKKKGKRNRSQSSAGDQDVAQHGTEDVDAKNDKQDEIQPAITREEESDSSEEEDEIQPDTAQNKKIDAEDDQELDVDSGHSNTPGLFGRIWNLLPSFGSGQNQQAAPVAQSKFDKYKKPVAIGAGALGAVVAAAVLTKYLVNKSENDQEEDDVLEMFSEDEDDLSIGLSEDEEEVVIVEPEVQLVDYASNYARNISHYNALNDLYKLLNVRNEDYTTRKRFVESLKKGYEAFMEKVQEMNPDRNALRLAEVVWQKYQDFSPK